MYTVAEYYKMKEFIFIDFIGFIIETYLFIHLINNFFKTKYEFPAFKFLQAGIVIVTGLLQVALGMTSGNNFFLYCFFLFSIPMLFSIIFYKGKLLSKILICLIFFTLIIYLDALICIVISYTSVNGFISYHTYLALFIVRRILFKIVLYFVSLFLLKFVILSHKVYNTYTTILLLTSCSVFIFFYNFFNSQASTPLLELVTLLCILIPLLLFYLINIIIVKNEENDRYKVQNYQLKLHQQYLEQFIQLSDSIKEFKHDYKAHLFCIDSLLMSGEYDSLHRYLENLHQMNIDIPTFHTYTPNKTINSILNQKQCAANASKIDFHIDVNLPTHTYIEDIDIVILISNLCDNAIEACTGLANACINISIKTVKAYLVIEVSNTVASNVLEQNLTLTTSKTNTSEHGFGIRIIKSITEAYDGYYQANCTDSIFSTKILLLDKTKENNKYLSQTES